ncbi:MAG: ATP-binding protein [Mariprofundaceae bacterium]|nr:ATP-binding protein [Mariprofundaceae bacterium]
MKKFTFKHIRTRLTIWFLLIALTPLMIAIFVTYQQRVAVIESSALGKLIAIRDLKVERLQDWLEETSNDLKVIAADFELAPLEDMRSMDKLSSNAFKNVESIRGFLQRFLSNHTAYSEIFIIHPLTGRIIVSTNKNREGADKSDYKYFNIPMQSRKLFIQDIYYSKTLSGRAMAFSMPVFGTKHDGKHVIGILVARIDLDHSLYPMLQDKVGLGKTGETLIVNSDVMALNELRWHKNAPLNLQIKAQPAVYASQGRTGTAVTTDYRGEQVLAAYTYIPKTGWGFVSKQDIYELKAPIRDMLQNALMLFIMSSIFIALVAYYISKQISKPIVEMSTLAGKITDGDYSRKNTVYTHDEIGLLGKSINSMAASIASRNSVQKGTAKISKVIVGQPSTNEFTSSLLTCLMEITESNMGAFYILNKLTSEFECSAATGVNKELQKAIKEEYSSGSFGKAVLRNNIYYLHDIPKEIIIKITSSMTAPEPKEIIYIPMVLHGNIDAFVSLLSNQISSQECQNILKQSWFNINASYRTIHANEEILHISEQLLQANKKLASQNIDLAKQSHKIEAANKELESFSYSVSHDLRAPLRAIDGFTRILMEDYAEKLDDEGKRVGSIIQGSATKMALLIDGLLAFSRLGRSSMLYSRIDMKKMVDAIYFEVSSTEERKKVNFIVADISSVEGDTILMRQVWHNLISNALKFSSHCKKPEISISCHEKEGSIIYSIKDNGAGFNMKYVDKLFGVFQRLHSESDFEGTGVGLSLVQRIIHRHGGKIWAEGHVNKGAEFYFSLPEKGESDNG